MSVFLPPGSDQKFYVIGQGIAGSVLAFLLDEKGYDVTIIDDGHLTSSSVIAAGMWNPVTFIRMQESWMSSELLPAMNDVYPRMETALNCTFYHPMELVRIFPDAFSANEWDEKSTHPSLTDFLSNGRDESLSLDFHQPFGHGIVRGAGWLDLPAMLEAIRLFFIGKKKYIRKSFTSEDSDRLISENHVVIECTGAVKIDDSKLNWVPITPNKGQVLTIRLPDVSAARMVNFGKFVVPVKEDLYRLGATFELNPLDADPSEAGKAELMDDLKKSSSREFEVINHFAGYRPTTPDRKPVIGFDDQIPLLGMFNGMGARGVMLAPFFAKQMIDFIVSGTAIQKDAHFLRCAKKHRK